ncbi:hypothetical protein LUZ61_020440 [Rhynchospora tenuis]|uniref:Peptidase A1 domain-containing protein n=1 Tax=Rhynchospora tenuis TaxID=198213 RepID=A0AAD6EP18_9POAL|nr:hypothetical protein LUZ61_020440 [Rhynchospora tenuis]
MAYSSIFFVFLIIALSSCYANKLGLDFHHRFSDKVREWTDSQGLPPVWTPEETPRGTVEYYKALLKHDLHRHHGRSLATGELYDFAQGNVTEEYYGKYNMVFNNYIPNASTTSKKISCSSNQCFTSSANSCTNKIADCTYIIEYADDSTSSGTLIQDDLNLIKQTLPSDIVKLPIVFGCAGNQTGNMPPNGIMGLSVSNISVPSILARNGLISDSFSMCFGTDGYGRLNFGDTGSADQYETALNINP